MPPRQSEQILAGRRSQPQRLIEVLPDIQEDYGYVSGKIANCIPGVGVPVIEVYGWLLSTKLFA